MVDMYFVGTQSNQIMAAAHWFICSRCSVFEHKNILRTEIPAFPIVCKLYVFIFIPGSYCNLLPLSQLHPTPNISNELTVVIFEWLLYDSMVNHNSTE